MVKRSFTAVRKRPMCENRRPHWRRDPRHVSQLRNGLSLKLPSRILTGGLRHLNLICTALQYLRFITAW